MATATASTVLAIVDLDSLGMTAPKRFVQMVALAMESASTPHASASPATPVLIALL